jgi:CheY-like chemotaxis protein/HPt (histidine-containing phosphotransfer) domain-containing protein
MGHSVQVAGSGEDAMVLLKDHDFDLALMDIGLPGMSGMGTTKAIRALDDTAKASLPVIALTGNVQDEDIRKCYAANMNGHIAKPIDPKKLIQQLQKVTDNELDNPVVIKVSEASQKTGVRQVSAMIETPPQKAAETTAESAASPDEYENSSPIQSFVDKQSDTGADKNSLSISESTTDDNSLESMSLDDIEDDSFESSIKQIEERDEKSDKDVPDEVFNIESDLSLDDENGLQEPKKDTKKDAEIINTAMLDSLKNSVGDEIMSSLLEGFLEKADEIILKIESLKGTGDAAELKARAHELKGMAGNFGVMEVSMIAEKMEELSKKDKFDEAIIFAGPLAKAQEKARDVLKDWL